MTDITTTPATDPIATARSELAKRFCRVVAVLDDEIEDKDNPKAFTEPFAALRKRFDDSSIICHLHHYPFTYLPPDDEANIEAVNRAFRIAAAADLVVIDWHLGMEKDPSHAITVIEKLAAMDGIRFVLINTRIQPSEVAGIIQNSFSVVHREIHDEAGAPVPLIRMRVGENFFISIRHKTGTAEDANELLKEAQGWLASSFPDHLHWAGLEIAVRVREMLPKVVAAMPRGSNAALAHQLLFQRDAEIADQITEVFLDELKLHFGMQPLVTASDPILFESLKTVMQKLVSDTRAVQDIHDSFHAGWQTEAIAAEEKKTRHAELKKRLKSKKVTEKMTAEEQTALHAERDALQAELEKTTLVKREETLVSFRQKLARIAEIWENPTLQALRVEKSRGNHFPSFGGVSDPIITAAYLRKAFDTTDEAFSSWASLKESAHLPFAEPKTLFPGCVLERITQAAGEHQWLLCVTPACDCYWKSSKGYLFVVGKEQSPHQRSSLATTQMWFREHNIAWHSKTLIVKSPSVGGPNIIPGYKVMGAIRSQFAARIIQRVWSYQSRVGVDTSEYYRDIRAE